MNLKFETITSRKNQRIIRAASLAEKKFRDEYGLYCIEGEKLFSEALCENIEICEVYFTEKAAENIENLLRRAEKNGAELFLVNSQVYDKLTSEKAPQGVFAVAKKKDLPEFSADALSDTGFTVLESLRDPSNVGAIIRTCAALGASKILLSDDCADIYSHKCLRASMGTVFKTEIYVTSDMAESILLLKKIGKVYSAALTDKAERLSEVSFKRCDSIVIGNEGHGVSEKTISACDASVIIPMQCGTESLNASVAAAILVWEKQKSHIEF